MDSYYINTDVEIDSESDLSKLAVYFEPLVDVLFCGQGENAGWHICLEAEGSGERGNHPVQDIAKLIEILKEARTQFAEVFASFTRFDFNVGWQSSKTRPKGEFTLPVDQLKDMVDLGAHLTVTIYPSDENDK